MIVRRGYSPTQCMMSQCFIAMGEETHHFVDFFKTAPAVEATIGKSYFAMLSRIGQSDR